MTQNLDPAVQELAKLLRYKRITSWLKFFVAFVFAIALFLVMVGYLWIEIQKDLT